MTEPLDPTQSESPYAAPKADLETLAVPETVEGVPFYAMSPTKLALMSFLTMGIYDLCFWWRQWRTRERAGDNISVFWRTVFAGFTSFGFNKTLLLALNLRDLSVPPLLRLVPPLYLGVNIIERMLERASEATDMKQAGFLALVCLLLVRASLLVVLQRAINDVLRADGYRGPYNRGVAARTLAVAVIGLLLWSFGLIDALNLFPEQPAS